LSAFLSARLLSFSPSLFGAPLGAPMRPRALLGARMRRTNTGRALARLHYIAKSASLRLASEDAAAHHPKFSADDFAAFTDARIAALKVGLKLMPAQEKNWPALETALREQAKARAARGDQ
jgi:hypothetical protein